MKNEAEWASREANPPLYSNIILLIYAILLSCPSSNSAAQLI